MKQQLCSCSCGEVKFNVIDQPLFRILCHCTICQRFNNAEFADIVVFDSSKIEPPAPGIVNFDTYKPPPNVQRGKCANCNKPAIELFETSLLPSLTIVPAAMFGSDAELPTPKAHLFYEKRVSEIEDDRPKYKGYLRSQLAFGKYLIAAKLFGKDHA